MKFKTALFSLLCFFSVSCGYTRLLYVPYPIPQYTLHPPLVKGFMAGVAKANINPHLGSFLAGYIPGWRPAIKVHDDLEVRTIVLRDHDGNLWAFVTVDSIGLQYADVLRLRKPLEEKNKNLHVFVFSSHTHSSADVIGYWGAIPLLSGRSERYVEYVIAKAKKTIADAVSRLEPAVPTFSSINVDGLQKARRGLVADNQLTVLRFLSVKSGSVIGAIINFGCHPTMMHWTSFAVSADYVDALRKRLDGEWTTTTLFVNGALGAVHPNIPWRKQGTFEKSDEFGNAIARYALHAITDEQPIDSDHLVYQRQVVSIPLENNKFWWISFLGLMPNRGIFSNSVTTEVNILRLGEVTLLMIPGELFPSLGLKLAHYSHDPRHTLIFGLANDEIGYIIDHKKFKEEAYRDERSKSIGPQAGEIIFSAAKQLLKETETAR